MFDDVTRMLKRVPDEWAAVGQPSNPRMKIETPIKVNTQTKGRANHVARSFGLEES
jgi:hypothetical protein